MPDKLYDVCVVGSGAAGGTVSSLLARSGAEVIVLEGGPPIDTRVAFNTHGMPFQFPNRQIPTMRAGYEGFDSERSRGIGGKTQLWNAVAWRFSPRDFKGRSFEGAGEDWPFAYSDIAPYYDQIEREVGVCGNLDGLEDLPDGIFLPPAPMRCTDHIIANAATKLGIRAIHVRKSTRTVASPTRPACHYCGNCMAGCDVIAKYNSWDVQMKPALKTGKLTVQGNSIVTSVQVNGENKAAGVNYIDRKTLRSGEVKARVVIVAAACVQSVALLMMSKSTRFPTGIGDSTGNLGKHFIPHFTSGVQACLTGMIGQPATNDEGFLDHAYIPSFMHNRRRDYFRSFGMQFNYHNRRSVGWARIIPGIGKDYKKAVKDRYPSFITMSPYGEMLPHAKSFIDLDWRKKDKFGLPAARRTYTWSENDWKIFHDMTAWARRIVETAGAEILAVAEEPRTNHELGGARMGNDPKTSVVDANCQVHDVKNLYVVDGSVFPSASEKNPTHTIMALAARLADHLSQRAKRGELA